MWWAAGVVLATALVAGILARRDLARRPASGVAPAGSSRSAFWHFTRPYRPHLATAVILTLLGVAVELAAPWPLAVVIDNAIGGDPLPDALAILAGLSAAQLIAVAAVASVAIVALGAALGYLTTYLNGAVQARIGSDLRVSVFGRLQRASIDFHDRHRSGDLLARLSTDVSYVDDMLVAWFETALPEALTVVGIVAILAAIDLPLAVTALLVIPILVWWAQWAHRSVRAAERVARDTSGAMLAHAGDTLRNARAVQVFSRESHEAAAFHDVSEATAASEVGALERYARLTPLASVILAIGTAAVLVIGATRVVSGGLTVGVLVVILAYVGLLYGPIESLSVLVLAMGRGAASRDRLGELLASEPGVSEPATPQALPAGPVPLSVRHVTFGYGEGNPVLRNLTFTVRPGEITCIVGPSGAGKSSILSLLVRLYDPGSGTIRLGPVDIRELPLATLRRQIALVPQDMWIAHGTVAENIAFGRPNATDQDIERAARLALVDRFLPDLPAGYETLIGDEGVLLSGGQRRRVALARALMLEAPILVLDEPTAGLDSHAADQVWQAIKSIQSTTALLVVTHDLELARHADRIYVVEAGRNVESGTHRSLLERQHRYAALWRSHQLNGDHAPPARYGPEAIESPGLLTAEKEGR